MNTRTIPTLLLSTLVLAACGDDTTIVSTFSYTNVSASNVTSFESMGPDTDTPQTSSGDVSGGTIGVSETSVTTSGDLGTTDGVEATTGTTTGTTSTTDTEDRPTTGEGSGPHCGKFVEVHGRAPALERFVVVDATACNRTDMLAIGFRANDEDEIIVPLGNVFGCLGYGGEDSAVAFEAVHVQVLIPGLADAESYAYRLFVNNEPGDGVFVPAVLAGQMWPDSPGAPSTPIRRTTAEEWTTVASHVPGCVPADD